MLCQAVPNVLCRTKPHHAMPLHVMLSSTTCMCIKSNVTSMQTRATQFPQQIQIPVCIVHVQSIAEWKIVGSAITRGRVSAGAQVSRLSVQSVALRKLLQRASSGFERCPQLWLSKCQVMLFTDGMLQWSWMAPYHCMSSKAHQSDQIFKSLDED